MCNAPLRGFHRTFGGKKLAGLATTGTSCQPTSQPPQSWVRRRHGTSRRHMTSEGNSFDDGTGLMTSERRLLAPMIDLVLLGPTRSQGSRRGVA